MENVAIGQGRRAVELQVIRGGKADDMEEIKKEIVRLREGIRRGGTDEQKIRKEVAALLQTVRSEPPALSDQLMSEVLLAARRDRRMAAILASIVSALVTATCILLYLS